jgi:ssDNA-binding replication factor A large subunit
MFSIKEMVKEISKASDLSEDDIKQKIEEKQIELSGLVSLEGAAYIVGKELGVSLLKENVKHGLKIKNVLPGMRSVDITGRVLRISNRKDFERDGKMKGVINLVIGDETGILRLSLWDHEIDLIEKLDIKENDVINVRNGYVRENGRGDTEIRLGRTGRISKSDANIPEVKDISKDPNTAELKSISELHEDEYSEVKASLIQVFKRNPFFEICPKCDSRLEKDGESWKCKNHGEVEPKYSLVLSGVIDDGSGNMRVIFFRDLAEKVLGKDTDVMKKISLNSRDPEVIYEELNLGKEFIIKGRIKKNQFTDKMELIANSVEEISSRKESEKLVHKIEGLKINKHEGKY